MFTPAQFQKIFLAFIVIIVVLGYFIFSTKVKPTPAPVIATETLSSAPTSNYLVEAEERRQQKLEEEAQAKLIQKRTAEKKNSVECQFWTQQQAKKTSDKIEEKVAKFCNLEETAQAKDAQVKEETPEQKAEDPAK